MGPWHPKLRDFQVWRYPGRWRLDFSRFFTVCSRTNGIFKGTFHGFFTFFHGVNVDRLTKTDCTCFHVFHVFSRFFMLPHVFSRFSCFFTFFTPDSGIKYKSFFHHALRFVFDGVNSWLYAICPKLQTIGTSFVGFWSKFSTKYRLGNSPMRTLWKDQYSRWLDSSHHSCQLTCV